MKDNTNFKVYVGGEKKEIEIINMWNRKWIQFPWQLLLCSLSIPENVTWKQVGQQVLTGDGNGFEGEQGETLVQTCFMCGFVLPIKLCVIVFPSHWTVGGSSPWLRWILHQEEQWIRSLKSLFFSLGNWTVIKLCYLNSYSRRDFG